MARLFIRSKEKSVVIVGEFCDWDIEQAKRYVLKGKNKLIVVDDMPKGEYRVLSCKSYLGGEVYPTDNRQMCNRYFSGEYDETITCYFGV